MQTKKEIGTIPVATRVTKSMLKEIQSVLKINTHINTADYIRDLIRRDLERWRIKLEEPQK